MKSTATSGRPAHADRTDETAPVAAVPAGMTRRQLLAGAAGLGAGALFCGWPVMASALEALPAPGRPDGELLGTVPFLESGDVRFGELSGTGLNGRRYFDLSTPSEDTLVTPSDGRSSSHPGGHSCGARSASGASTKRRSYMRGWGITSSAVSSARSS